MKTRIVICASLVVSCHLLFSQNSFQGTVQNTENQPVPNTIVYDSHQKELAKTDYQGLFRLSVKEKTAVVIQSKGYETLFDTVYPERKTQLFVLFNQQERLEEIQIQATRASSQTPTTYSNVSKEEIDRQNFGQDLPYLLNGMLSTVVASDAGAGVGYTNLRIRGVDGTGTNVTINGIPVNDAESQNVFWVNMPDFASSIENIQVQRGVGTSSNGGATFGASLNIKTSNIRRKGYVNIDNSYGSFNTWKNSIQAGTGVLNEHFYMDMRLSNITSNGYVDRGASNLKSFYTSGAWFNKNSMLKFTIFGGKETTYQSWNGIPESRLKNDRQGMLDYAVRNGLSVEETDNLLNSGRTYNYFTYANQVDHYNQTHYQLHFSHRFTPNWSLNVSGHYTRGKGYYEEYKSDQDLADYGISSVILGSDTVSESNLIRRKWLDNHFFGMVYNANYSKGKLNIDLGGGINQYLGRHLGDVIWAQFASNSQKDQTYYNDNASKLDFNQFIKASYQIQRNVLFADLQVRGIHYVFEGISDLSATANTETQKADYLFVNPKIGWSFLWNDFTNSYVSVAMSNREPIRKDFTENVSNHRPKPETLYDLEIGNRYHHKKWMFNANFYTMYYTNQLIVTGEINDVGGTKRINVKQSYRLGVEMEATYKATPWFTTAAGVTYSINRVNQFDEHIADYDNGGEIIVSHRNSRLAMSPDLIASFAFNFEPIQRWNIRLNGKYISRQYLDNTNTISRSIDDYFVMNLNINYTLQLPKIEGIEFGFQVNNLLNALYSSNGYTYGYFAGGKQVQENFYFPQAGINCMGRICIRI